MSQFCILFYANYTILATKGEMGAWPNAPPLNTPLITSITKIQVCINTNASRSSPRGFISEDPHIMWWAFASVPTIVGICSFLNYVGKRQKPLGKFAQTVFVFLFCRSPEKSFWRPFLFRSPEKKFWRPFFWEHLRLCPWSLASSIPALGLERVFPRKDYPWPQTFLCSWPWPRALCPRLHLCRLIREDRYTINT